MINLARRGFIFGASAALILPPVRTFHILDGRHAIIKPIIIRPDKVFDLPLQQMMDLLSRLDAAEIELSAIPRWAVVDKEWYDKVVRGFA